MSIPIIDLFAGPGGLSEGFTKVPSTTFTKSFKIKLSVEMDQYARSTLSLRSLHRLLETPSEQNDYLGYIKGDKDLDELSAKYPEQSVIADREAWLAELGVSDRLEVRDRIDEALNGAPKWVLLGGPPCQAYSMVGRSRMLPVLGKEKFFADSRHQLYKEYLRILADHAPTVFIFENVKGLLSSKLHGEPIFDRIRKDLCNPASSVDSFPKPRQEPAYRLFSLTDSHQSKGDELTAKDFIVRSEQFGIPQTRHRVIILGIRQDFLEKNHHPIPSKLVNAPKHIPIEDVIADLPKLRSATSRPAGSFKDWCDALTALDERTGNSSDEVFNRILPQIKAAAIEASDHDRGVGSSYTEYSNKPAYNPDDWYTNNQNVGITCHQSRSHMRSDLQRYLFSSTFASSLQKSPTLRDFPTALMPAHRNAADSVRSGNFADRFRVQIKGRPATTITSHISKDGHYFIHYDPSQCRSLSVREAARIQTFPDNYHFEGPRTHQFTQVGNAVPPYLAFQIAQIVSQLLD